MTVNYHHLVITCDETGFTGRVVCTAPEGADCRMYCLQGCEIVDDFNDHEHPIGDVGYCYQTEGWLDDVEESYSGEHRTTIIPVDVEWEGDLYTWRLSDPKPPAKDTGTLPLPGQIPLLGGPVMPGPCRCEACRRVIAHLQALFEDQ